MDKADRDVLLALLADYAEIVDSCRLSFFENTLAEWCNRLGVDPVVYANGGPNYKVR